MPHQRHTAVSIGRHRSSTTSPRTKNRSHAVKMRNRASVISRPTTSNPWLSGRNTATRKNGATSLERGKLSRAIATTIATTGAAGCRDILVGPRHDHAVALARYATNSADEAILTNDRLWSQHFANLALRY